MPDMVSVCAIATWKGFDMDGTIGIGAVLAGRAVPFGRPGKVSAIAKHPVDGPRAVGIDGIEGDEQGEKKIHGGPDKAVHHYPFDHYAAWRAELADQPAGSPALLREPGAFGENLSTTGLTEAGLCLGDVWRAGTALLQVAQSRQPCWKLNVRFGVPDMAVRVQNSGRTGWYWRVLEPGTIGPGDRMAPVERPRPDWTLARVQHLLYVDVLNRDALAALLEVDGLPASWRKLAENRLARGKVEDWSARLGNRHGGRSVQDGRL